MKKIIGLFIIGLLFVSCGDNKPKERIKECEAKVYAEYAVEKLLQSPSSAKFSKINKTSFRELGILEFEGYFVEGYVDSQNGFGAMIRSKYYVEVYYDKANGKVKIKNARIL